MDTTDDIGVSICWGATRIGEEQHKLGIEIGPGLGQDILRQVDHTKPHPSVEHRREGKWESGVDLQPQHYVKEPAFSRLANITIWVLVSSARTRKMVAERFKNT